MGCGRRTKKTMSALFWSTFESIFKSDHPTNFNTSLEAINQRVSSEMNDRLVAKFNLEEVRRALKQMHPTEAPGLDGMSPIFYQ